LIKRNLISLVLFSLILSAGVVATVITVRDIETITQDLGDSTFFPDFPDDNNDQNDDGTINEGILNLYYDSELITQNQVAEEVNFPLYPLPNNTLEILHLWINVTSIRLIGKGISNSTFLQEKQRVDLVEVQNQPSLFMSGNISEGTYSTIQIYYENTIVVETNEGKTEMILQGSNFATLAIKEKKGSTNIAELKIWKNKTTSLYLNFMITINSITNTAILNLSAFLEL